jgi:hypothetical protein
MGRKTPGVPDPGGSGGIPIGKPCPKQILHPLVSAGNPVSRGLGRSIRVVQRAGCWRELACPSSEFLGQWAR